MYLINNAYLPLFGGSLLAGISTYLVLTYLFVPITVTIPTGIILFVLVFGLSRYYTSDNQAEKIVRRTFRIVNRENDTNTNTNRKLLLSVSNVFFITIYLVSLIVTGFYSSPSQDLFIPWNQFTIAQIVKLTASILLCFFLPGYAIVSILYSKKQELTTIPKVILAYTFSIAFIGLGGYISASIGIHTSEIKPVLLGIYAAVLIMFILTKSISRWQIESTNYFQRLKDSIFSNSAEFLVFGSLLALLILSTYTIYQGVIIGDQWFHHGRALSLLGGGYNSEIDNTFYPAFFHGVLAAFFSLSGVPSVNAYSSINFLNILAVFAFYYFFKKWVPSRNPSWQKASLLACTFFMLSSGFGWVNMITASISTNPVNSPHSSAELFRLVESRTLDIHRAGSFIITSSPQIGTNLTIIALPLGFMLLGLVKERITSRLNYIVTLGTITTVGIFAHDEFYLFIIISCLLPLIFKLSEKKNTLYGTFLCSILIVACLDITFNVQNSTVRYYTAISVSGIPILILIALFVGLMWFFYATGIIFRLFTIVSTRATRIRKVPGASRVLKYSVAIALVAVIAYLYIFSFLVWGPLTAEEIQLHQDPFDLPWYLYPMKLGVTGLLGISFILSFFFRKFEREVFIFGLIAIIALLLGPYYDEYRFSKFIMVAMGAFASIFISMIIISMNSSKIKLLLAGLIIGAIITSSSLSVLIFNGYIALALQRPDIKEFSILLRNKIFPSMQEISFLNYLQTNINFKDIIALPFEYGDGDSKLKLFKDQQLANKIQAFVGSPMMSPIKFLKNPFALNASTIVGLYSLLSSDNVKYIILPKENIIDDKIQQPMEFILKNFQRAYEDPNYLVLTVPPIAPPNSSINDIALVYQPEGKLLSSLISGQKIIQFNNESFKAIRTSDFLNMHDKKNGTLTIFNGDKRSTLWTNPLQQKEINLIQAKFRTIGENDSAMGSSGIAWQSQGKEYDISLNRRGLQLSEKPSNLGRAVLLSEDQHVKNERYTWHTLKVLTVGNTIAVYLDDMLKLQVHTDVPQDVDINKVGIRVDHNTAQFEPISVGHLSDMSQKKEIYYHHYYPISELALSNASYDTFAYGDMSALSHKTIILTLDPLSNDTNFQNYLNFVNEGGRLVVINTMDNFVGGFSKLLNVKASNITKFDGIVDEDDDKASHAIEVSGSARMIDLKSVNASVKSYYMNNDKKVAPFALERKYGSAGGEIIFVNSAGYFEAVFKSPQVFFMTLGKIPNILGLEA